MNATLESVIYDLVTSGEKIKAITFPIDSDNDEMEMKVEWADGTASWWQRGQYGWKLCEPFVPSLVE